MNQQGVNSTTLQGQDAVYVQAWECVGPNFSGYIYDQSIAIDKLLDGCNIESVTIIRHNNGDREYLKGAVMQEVFNYRESQQSE